MLILSEEFEDRLPRQKEVIVLQNKVIIIKKAYFVSKQHSKF